MAYEPMVMYFSLCNSPATFQNMMNHIFHPLKDKWAKKGVKIIVYMDDIWIATSTSLQDHWDATHDVLDLLQEHNLFLKKKKWWWEVNSIDYLGLILEKGVTCMDLTKVEGIKTWPQPAKVKDVCSFLGFCNFYWPFIPSFSKIAKPLNELTCKDVPFAWEDKHKVTFNALRDLVTSEPVLRQPQLDKTFEVKVDASGFALGGVLLQRQEDDKKHPIGYYLATLNEAQWNYNIYELELLAIAECLKHWRPYLTSSPHEIIVHTDHANLTYWHQPQKISRHIARQVLELEEYNIKLQHVPGKNNGNADALSRRPDYDQGMNDNQDVTILPDRLFIRALASQELEQNKDILKPWVDHHKLKQISGTWWKGNQLVITADIPSKRTIVQIHHDPPAYSHPGISRTLELTARKYWWPHMAQDVKDYVKGCADCQWNKSNNQVRKAPLSPIFAKPGALPFEMVAMDFIVKLPLSNGYDLVLTITDHNCTKAVILIPCNETITAKGVAKLYLEHVFKCVGLPKIFIHDQDTWFMSNFVVKMCQVLGIKQNTSTVFHPRTDSQSEWTNQKLEQFLQFYANTKQNNWAHFLSLAKFAFDSWRNESMKKSPFEVLLGYNLLWNDV